MPNSIIVKNQIQILVLSIISYHPTLLGLSIKAIRGKYRIIRLYDKDKGKDWDDNWTIRLVINTIWYKIL